MSELEKRKLRIQQKINPGDTRFNANTLDFVIDNKSLFFYNTYCYNKKYDFALSQDMDLRIGIQHQHLTKDRLGEIIAAGSIIIDSFGDVIYLDNQSGTFQFRKEEQEEYLKLIESLVSLHNCRIYDIDYSLKHDPVNPFKTEVENIYYDPNKYDKDTEKHKKYIKPISKDKWEWVLLQNKFNHKLYHQLNEDLNKLYTVEHRDELYTHFYNHGQYEVGRGVGFYD